MVLVTVRIEAKGKGILQKTGNRIPRLPGIAANVLVVWSISLRICSGAAPSLVQDFGSAAVGGAGNSFTLTFSISALPGAPGLSIGGVDFSAGSIACNTNFTSCTVPVTFAPRTAGLKQDALVLKNASGNLVASAFLHGIGIAPVLQVLPASISTMAGNGKWNYIDGAASAASFRNPQGLAVDLFGNVYVADSVNQVVRKIAAGTGNVSTVAGTGIAGFFGDGGPALKATLNTPTGVAVDAGGNLFIADQGNALIRRVDAVSGLITTVAGGGGSTANNGPATGFALSGPNDIAVDAAGNLYISDSYNQAIRKVSVTTNILTTVAGGGTLAGIDGIGDGGPATGAALDNPTGITLDTYGNLYFADTGHSMIRRIDASSGVITVVAGNGSSGSDGDGGLATNAALISPTGVRLDAAGNLYIADMASHRIRLVNSLTGIISTLAGTGSAAYSGDGGISTSASLNNPMDVVFDPSGNLLVADYSNNVVRKISFVPPVLTFPSTDMTLMSAVVPVTLNNVGLANLSLSAVSVTAGFQQKASGAVDCGASISVAAGASCQADLVFAPSGAGRITGALTVHSNSNNLSSSQVTVQLAGTGVSGYPVAVLSTAALTFSSLAVGTTSPAQTVTLTNSGTASMAIETIQITGANSSDFSVSSTTCASTLPANSSCSVAVTVKPLLAGSRAATLTISDSAANSPQTVTLAATGTGGAIPALSVTGLSFASQIINSASATQTVILTNNGSAVLSIFSIAMSGINGSDFPLNNYTCGVSLNPAASCSVTLSFVPTATGVRNASLLFLLSAGTSPQAVSLAGTGLPTPCVTSISPSTQVYAGSGASDSVVISAPSNCAWSAASNAGWIAINTASTGVGSTTLQYTVAANTTAQPRTGTLSIGGQTKAITEMGFGLRFVAVTPCRILDTRNPNGPFGGPQIAGGTSRDFAIPSSGCGIPASAQAYSLNLTVVPSGILGYLSIWPTGQAQPATSVLNSDGRVKANAAVVAAGTNGAVTIYASNSTHVIVDISGYFVPATTSSALSFYPLTPCRIADTRNSPGIFGQPYMPAQSTRNFPVLSSACNVPATAQAYSLNFTVVPRGPNVGYISVWPTGQPQPLVSTLNVPTAEAVANAAIMAAGISGGISVFTTDNADVIIDINGYFAPPQSGGLSFYATTPCRALDTRAGNGSPFMGTLTVSMLNLAQCPLPAQVEAYVLSATVVPEPALSFLTLWPNGNAQPTVSTLNAPDGAVTSNLALVPSSNGAVNAYVPQPTHLILDLNGFFSP